MSYSQMFHWPVQAGWAPMVEVFDDGQRIEKTIFLPSNETSGSRASPLPCVNWAVMLCSAALGEDFSRIMRSPPGIEPPTLVGLALMPLTRWAYTMGTSPATVSVLWSLVLPPLQPASSAKEAHPHAPMIHCLFMEFSGSIS